MNEKLHLGCGENYFEGWINIDIKSKTADKLMDLRLPFSFPKNSVSFIFNEHFLEHLTLREGIAFLRECFRILVPKGVLRISTPDVKYLIFCYNNKILTTWNDEDWSPRTACQMLNGGMSNWGHKFLYDEEEIFLVLRHVGFRKIIKVLYKESNHLGLRDLEKRPYHNELIVEATK
jgi:predicted SAM-dependent methyltransferase